MQKSKVHRNLFVSLWDSLWYNKIKKSKTLRAVWPFWNLERTSRDVAHYEVHFLYFLFNSTKTCSLSVSVCPGGVWVLEYVSEELCCCSWSAVGVGSLHRTLRAGNTTEQHRKLITSVCVPRWVSEDVTRQTSAGQHTLTQTDRNDTDVTSTPSDPGGTVTPLILLTVCEKLQRRKKEGVRLFLPWAGRGRSNRGQTV